MSIGAVLKVMVGKLNKEQTRIYANMQNSLKIIKLRNQKDKKRLVEKETLMCLYLALHNLET